MSDHPKIFLDISGAILNEEESVTNFIDSSNLDLASAATTRAAPSFQKCSEIYNPACKSISCIWGPQLRLGELGN
jgi:hypothetical protein